MSILQAGKLVSTTDMQLAKKLNSIVSVNDITKGKTPQALQQSRRSLSFYFNNEFYELARA